MTMTPFLPMLAVRSEPFDSGEYLFEVKWNGIRALAGRDSSGWRLWGRDLADYRPRYPELQFLNRLPPGTVVDGELVLLRDGAPDLDILLARHQRSQPAAIQHLSHNKPVPALTPTSMASPTWTRCCRVISAANPLLSSISATPTPSATSSSTPCSITAAACSANRCTSAARS